MEKYLTIEKATSVGKTFESMIQKENLAVGQKRAKLFKSNLNWQLEVIKI